MNFVIYINTIFCQASQKEPTFEFWFMMGYKHYLTTIRVLYTFSQDIKCFCKYRYFYLHYKLKLGILWQLRENMTLKKTHYCMHGRSDDVLIYLQVLKEMKQSPGSLGGQPEIKTVSLTSICSYKNTCLLIYT